MEILVPLLSIRSIVCVVAGHPLSLIELVGITSGLVSVYWASTMNPHTWTAGLVNIAAFFAIFYQVNLYSDMFLQMFFAGATVYGWTKWRAGTLLLRKPQGFSLRVFHRSVVAIAIGTAVLALVSSNLHVLLPALFPKPAAFPVLDGFISTTSIVATILLARRHIETWVWWILVDVVSVPLYFARGIPFMGLLYGVFLVLAINGLIRWLEEIPHETRISVR